MWREVTDTMQDAEWYSSINAEATRLAEEHGIAVFDARSLGAAAVRQAFAAEHMWWDSAQGGRHPWQYMYESINDLLLNVLCDEQCKWVE